MKYEIILFDADGTLLDFKRSEREALREALLSIGISADDEMIATYSRINDGLWKMLERGEIEKSVLLVRRFEDFFAHYGLEGDAPDLAERYMKALSEKGYAVVGMGRRAPEDIDALERLGITFVQGDLSSSEDRKKLLDTAVSMGDVLTLTYADTDVADIYRIVAMEKAESEEQKNG